jgi:hypothetical protein
MTHKCYEFPFKLNNFLGKILRNIIVYKAKDVTVHCMWSLGGKNKKCL